MRRLVLEFLAVVAVLASASAIPPAAAADTETRLKQAAQHFVDLEDDQAKTILEDLSAEGVADADVLLGYLFSDPFYEGRDYERAVAAFEQAAAVGNSEAQFQLAESRFWPDYSDWILTKREESIRPTADDTFRLLHEVIGEHNATKWRRAWLCTLGGYDCSGNETHWAIGDATRIVLSGLRDISGYFKLSQSQLSGEAATDEGRKLFETYLALGYAVADPFVAAFQSDAVWRGVSDVADCPDPDYIDAAGRLMALENGTATHFEGRLDFRDCYDEAEIAEIKRKLGIILDQAVRTFGNETNWATRWCYENHDWPAIGQCLITTVRDHFFACTKLSMPKYFNERFQIEYRDSKRYQRCREHMQGAREG